jgi:hypothetical protein
MTYRDKIFKSTMASYIYSLVGAVVVFTLIPLLIKYKIQQPVALVIGALSFATIYCYGLWKIKCEKCNFRFYNAHMWRVKFGNKNKRLNFCPHCGVNLDEKL